MSADAPAPKPQPKTFIGHLVILSVRDKMDVNKLPKKFTPDSMAELQQYRVAQHLAKQLTKHFLRIERHGDEIHTSMAVTLLVDKVPDGIAHTKIVFQEYKP